jgi:hypothetical protein
MAGALDRSRTWVGAFIKQTQDSFIAGTETYNGLMVRLDDPRHNFLTFASENLRLGAGAGASFSVGTIIFFNVGQNLWWIEEQSLGHGWSLSADLPIGSLGKVHKVIRAVKQAHSVIGMIHEVQEMIKLAVDLWGTLVIKNSNPIIHIATESSVSMSTGLMRSFGGTIDIQIKVGKGGVVTDF